MVGIPDRGPGNDCLRRLSTSTASVGSNTPINDMATIAHVVLPGTSAFAAPLSGRRTLEAESRTAHTSVQPILTGVHTPTETFQGSLIRRQRHEQSLADHRCRARDGGGDR